MPPRKRQIEKKEDHPARQLSFSKRRKRLFKKAKEHAVTFSETNKDQSFADPRRTSDLETIEAHRKQPPLEGKEEFDQLTKTLDEEKLIIGPLEGNEHENLSKEELELLEERTQYTLSLVKAKRREKEHYESIRGEVEQTVEKINGEFQKTMGFRSTDEAGELNGTGKQRTSPDSAIPANP